MKTLRRHYPALTFALWAAGCWAFFQLCYPYHFFYKEQNQLFLTSGDYLSTYFDDSAWLARLAGDWLTQYYYYMYAGATILTAALLLLGVLLYRLLRHCRLGRAVALAVAVATATVEGVFHLHHDFPLSATVSAIGLAALLWAARPLLSRQRKAASAAIVAVTMAVGYWLFGIPKVGQLSAPNWWLERQLVVDNEYYFGHYDRVVRLVEQDSERTPEMLFFYYLVQAQRGQLPDRLLHFDRPELGTFYHIGPETPMLTIKNMNELYYALGDMMFTERAAMMANVFSPQNRNVRMIRRLAECALVSGDTAAADKYLRLLRHTTVYRRWAEQAPQNPIYQQKARFANHQDTIVVSDNAHAIMMQLLDSNADNTVALDYILCSNLLLKDLTSFHRDYDRYCGDRPRLKELYQQALCVYLAGTNAPQEQWEHYIKMPSVLQRFAAYNQQRGSAAFKGTYWYYFDTAPTPKPKP